MDGSVGLLYTFAMRPPRVPWSRPEAFGAWVRLDDQTLVAVDRDLAERLSVSGAGSPRPGPTRPLELHIAVTSRCNAPCDGCYMNAHPKGADVPLVELRASLAAARDAGVSTVAFGGGEPLLHRNLEALAEEARALGLVPVMTTSGAGLTPERARSLRAFAQINVSYDGAEGGYLAVRGWDGAAIAERAIETLAQAGIRVGANVVLTRNSFDLLAATSERVAEKGASEIQLLRYKPGGRAAAPSYEARRLTPEQIDLLWPSIQRVAEAGRLRVRIDCALLPLLSSALGTEPDIARRLSSFGVFGCEAARHLAGLRADGTVAPCSFFASEPPLIALSASSASNATSAASPDSALITAWSTAADLEAIRAYHASPPEPCRSCELFTACRGGCQVVSRFLRGGSFGPDPECPRVALFAKNAINTEKT
jgi:radical SAM protein with 4Fe4S-binding SPASM domain